MLPLTSCVHVTAVARVVERLKCPYCIENCDFESYVLKPSSCLEKDSTGSFIIKKGHQYYYQCQQQIFTIERQYCDFVVCAFGHHGMVGLVHQRLLPDTDHWKTVVPKLTNFWRICVLPEVLGRWYTRRHDAKAVESISVSICYCRTATMEDTVTCSNPKCQIVQFHYSCLGIVSIPKLWYCPTCRTLPEFKRNYKRDKTAKENITPQEVLNLDFICLCKQKAKKN